MASSLAWQLIPPWIEHVLSPNENLSFSLHQSQLKFEHHHHGPKVKQEGRDPLILAWKEEHLRLNFRPILPSKSLVAKGEYPLIILPDERTDIWVTIPLSVQLLTQRVRVVKNFDLYPFQKTWFGDGIISGEICYLNPSYWEQNQSAGKAEFCQTMVTLCNQSNDPIEINEIKIPCAHLSLFLHQKDEHFYTDALTYTKSEIMEWQTSIRFPFNQSELLLIAPGKNLGRGKNIIGRALNGQWGESS